MDQPRQRETEGRLKALAAELLKNPEGRFFLRWLIEASGTFKAKYPESHAQAAFQEGSRAIGCALFALICDLEGFEQIFREERNG